MTQAVETRRGAFDSDLAVQAAGPRTWRTLAPLIWTGTSGDTFTVPLGFETDFATVPRFLHWLVSPYGAYTRAAVLHDWLLVELAGFEIRERQDPPPPANSRDTDGIFRRAMQDLGVPFANRWIMWAAVRLASCFSPLRSYGRQFWRDAARVFAIGAVIAPFALPGAVGVLVSLGLIRLVTGVANLLRPGRTGQRKE